ncbi:MAG: putative bifunctional diguanylate cyclase/phosphodiesterase [Sphingomonadaceae bacterium]
MHQTDLNSAGAMPQNDADWLLFEQLAVPAEAAKSATVANLLNATIMGLVFYQTVPWTELVAGLAVLVLLLSWRIMATRNLSQNSDQIDRLSKIQQSVEWNAAALGGWWGVVVGHLVLVGSTDQRMLVGIVGAGMMSAGAISYRSLHRAAKLYATACTVGSISCFAALGSSSGYAAAGLTICYLFVLFGASDSSALNIRAYLVNRREAEHSAETIKLLLNDFTEQGSDWLFELDSDGLLVAPSHRLAEAAMRPIETLSGKSFVSLFDEGQDRSRLVAQIRRNQPFRHQIVPLTINGAQRWWSINARPASGNGIAFRGVVTDITAQRQAEEKVSYMAHYDGLTDLPNRFMFNESLYRAFNRRSGKLAMMYLDLDNFKAINDTLGHPVGDQLLKAAARRLEDCVTSKDIVARLGGDEFAILVAPENVGTIDAMADAIVRAMASPFALDGHDVVIGVSIGIACAPQDADTAEKLLQNADLALYSAKTSGRNRSARFEIGMDEAAQARRILEMDLRGSLGKNEMRLHYQPLVNVESGKTSGYEALIRWEHPERGIVMPNLFIPIAEETGMIVQIGEWVIRQALDDMARWEQDLSVSINLSPAQMRSPSLVTTIINALAQTGVEPNRVCLEITETVLMQDTDANIETLHKLSSLGVSIALDDFGTGYSSLNYLRSFPFDKIKIDRCFVSEIDTREDCQAIVRSVVALATSLGMTTTAEGVERPEQFEQLRIEGCGEVQGFLYSKAVPVDQLSNLRSPKPSLGSKLAQLADQRQSRIEAQKRSGAARKQG